MRKASIGLAIALGLAMSAAGGSVASAGDLDGTWLRPKTGKHVRSFSCGGGLGLRVVDTGKVIMCGAKSNGKGTFTGNLTSTEDGQTYTGKVRMGGSSLSLSGCVLGGLICKNETWSRVN